MFEPEFWWIFPLVMIVLCFLFMRGKGAMMCGLSSHNNDNHHRNFSGSARELLDKRNPLGEINKMEAMKNQYYCSPTIEHATTHSDKAKKNICCL